MHKSRLYLKSFHCNTMSEPKMLYLELDNEGLRRFDNHKIPRLKATTGALTFKNLCEIGRSDANIIIEERL